MRWQRPAEGTGEAMLLSGLSSVVFLRQLFHLLDRLHCHDPTATIRSSALATGDPFEGIPLIIESHFAARFNIAEGKQSQGVLRKRQKLTIWTAGMIQVSCRDGRFERPFLVQFHGVAGTAVLSRWLQLTGDLHHQLSGKKLASGEHTLATLGRSDRDVVVRVVTVLIRSVQLGLQFFATTLVQLVHSVEDSLGI